MTALNLTVQVLNLSPKVAPGDLNVFFSYCGTVDKIQLYRNKDQSQTALVIFRQPYAYQTALLLNGAFFAGRTIQVLPVKVSANLPIQDIINNETKKNKERQGFIPAVHAGMQAIASKSVEVLKKTKEVEENYKLSEKGRLLMDQTKSFVCAAEQAAGHIGAKIVNNGAHWLSSALDNASKPACPSKIGNPNSRKQR